ncbi:helix-turn-helix domain-containing protein [Leptolyngbya sp. 15MV]|nr:helix-turn-helix domain-containing protein [Leptolyngbya sp. 15MV]
MSSKARIARKGVSLAAMTARLPEARQRAVAARADELVAQHMALRDVRKALGRTQVQLARKLGIQQANVARVEQRSDMLISTLRDYVKALGGDLYLTVEMKDMAPIRLDGLGDLGPPQPGRRKAA